SAPAFLGPPAVARRRAAILALLDRHAAISRKTVIEACGCSPGTAARDLEFLLGQGLLRAVPGATPRLGCFIRPPG
ncbi:MAG: DeoR-like helix-turn-helix domain, partial [Planctomycetota bacterium]